MSLKSNQNSYVEFNNNNNFNKWVLGYDNFDLETQKVSLI